jgi:carbonic anhydrase/acetyltransferase-like protein (isoleucine patch superfamily)
MIRGYGGKRPQVGKGAFLAETAAVIGDVVIGDDSSIWYGTVVRGDVMPIRIGARTSIQDNSVIHVTSGSAAPISILNPRLRRGWGTVIGSDCTVGHNAILHGCTVEDFCLIGMGAIVLDGARIGSGSLVGAGALVTPGTDIPPGSLVIGSPARVTRTINDKEREQITYGAKHYVELTRRYLAEQT